MSLFDDVKKNLMEWYAVTSEKTTEVARLTSRGYDKFGISRDIERQFSELGSLVYNGLREGREDLLEDSGVKALVARIEGLEAELNAKNDEMEAIRKKAAERKAAATAEAAVVTETIIKDPELEEGTEESAILVEPTEEAVGSGDQDPPRPE